VLNVAIAGSTATSSTAGTGGTIYVDEGAAGGGDGSTGSPYTKAEFEALTFADPTNVTWRATATTWTITTTGDGIDFPSNTNNTVDAGDTVTISGVGTGANRCDRAFNLTDKTDVTVDGFTVAGQGVYSSSTVSTVASVDGSSGCTITNCTITDTYGEQGIAIDDYSTTTPVDFTFSDNTWTGHGAHYDIHGSDDYGNGIYIVRGENIKITGNTFTRVGGHSTLEVRRCNGLIISGNFFNCDWTGQGGVNSKGHTRAIEMKANGTTGGSSDGNYNWLIEDNFSYLCGGVNDQTYPLTPAHKIGGQLGVFRNNVTRSTTGFCTKWLMSATGNFMDDLYCYNNTFYISDMGVMEAYAASSSTDLPGRSEIFNNVCQDQRNDPLADARDDTELRWTLQDILASDELLNGPTLFEYNIVDVGADGHIEGASGPDTTSLTTLETNEPSNVNNNTQSSVFGSFPNGAATSGINNYVLTNNGGRAQTTVAVADTGSGTTLVVGNTRMFKDTMGGMRTGDTIYIGGTSAVIASIDSDTQISLVSGVSRSDGDDVIWGPAYDSGNVLQGVVGV